MKITTLLLVALCAAFASGCMEELETLPEGTVTAPKLTESGHKNVVTSSVKEYVPPPALARELDACKVSLADARARLTASEAENAALTSNLGRMTLDRDSALSRGGDLEKQLAAEAQNGRDLQQRLARLEQEAALSRETEQRLTQDLQSAQKKVSESQMASQQQIDLAEQEISRRKAALAETTRHLATLDQDKQKIAAALAESQQRLDALSATLSAEQAKTASLSRDNQRLEQEYGSLKKSLEAELADRDLKLRQAQSRVVVTILDHVLFDSGRAVLKPSGAKVLDQLSVALKKIGDKDIHVEGHTDNRPIHGPLAKQYATNWELSTARATTVVRYLIEQAGLPAGSLSAAGYADTKPVAPNDTDTSRSENRRIEILLYPKGLPKISQPLNP